LVNPKQSTGRPAGFVDLIFIDLINGLAGRSVFTSESGHGFRPILADQPFFDDLPYRKLEYDSLP
jgi:hypothetical protein